MGAPTLLTIARAPGASLCKTITPEGAVEAPDFPTRYDFSTHAVHTIAELFDLLTQLRLLSDRCVVRGHASAPSGPRSKETLADTPQSWVCLDFDSVEEAFGLDFKSDPEACAEYLRAQLPTEFQACACVWRASQSAGIKPGIRLHLWFLLSEPIAQTQCVAWFGDCLPKIDLSLFRPTQPHFTADPDLHVADPMPERIGLLRGTERVDVPSRVFIDSTPARTQLAIAVDPLTQRGLRAWELDNAAVVEEYAPGTTRRLPCPACGSSDGVAVRDDGRLNCHGAKHAENADSIGTPVNGCYVGTLCEFVEKITRGQLSNWLRERYPVAFDFHAFDRPKSSVNHPTVLAETPDISDLQYASKQLENTLKSLKKTSHGYAVYAEKLGRFTPHLLDQRSVAEQLCTALAGSKPPVPASESTEVILAALAKGALDPWERGTTESALAVDKLGNVVSCFGNVLKLCSSDEIADVLCFDVRSALLFVRAAPPWKLDDTRPFPRVFDDNDSRVLAAYLADVHSYASAFPSQIYEACTSVGELNSFDPLADYVQSCEWHDDLDVARELLATVWINCAGVTDSPYARAVSLRWFLGAVNRALYPGCHSREALILQGPQSYGKSRALRALCPESSWFLEGIGALHGKESKELLLGKWICELPEIEDLIRTDRAGLLKQFLSTAEDTFRPSYARAARTFRRGVVFAGTTNEFSIFKDATGNSRFNVLQVGSRVDVKAIEDMRDEIWGAARALLEAGEQPYLTDSEALLAVPTAQLHYAVGDLEDTVLDFVDSPVPSAGATLILRDEDSPYGFKLLPGQKTDAGDWAFIGLDQLCKMLDKAGVRRGSYARVQIQDVLRRAGWCHGRLRRSINVNRLRVFTREAGLVVGVDEQDL